MKAVSKFLVLSLMGLLLINLTFVNAYWIFGKYFGSVTLNPGEHYIVNIPFIGPSKSPTICGEAEQNDGTPLPDIKVIANYSSNHSKAGEATTNSNGEYCIILQEIKGSEKFDISLEYNDVTSNGDQISLGSNDYDLNFDNNKIYHKNSDKYVSLSGNITNEDAKIENGRFEIKLDYGNTGNWTSIFDYKKYSVNIDSNQVSSIPNNDLNISWAIPNDAQIGKYKFYIKTSFNAKDHSSTIYFNITA